MKVKIRLETRNPKDPKSILEAVRYAALQPIRNRYQSIRNTLNHLLGTASLNVEIRHRGEQSQTIKEIRETIEISRGGEPGNVPAPFVENRR